VRARRLLTAAVAFAWLLPTLVAGAVALHVAFEHPVDRAHHGSPEPRTAPASAEPEHVHPVGETRHEHSIIVTAGSVAMRRALDSTAHAAAVGATEVPVCRIEAGAHAPAPKELAGPPKASGPPLLARLSTFRI
jgi:hypothetical protein